MTRPLEGKFAVVTGASEGIGLASANAMAEAGATVVAISRSPEKLAAAFSKSHNSVIQMPADLLDDQVTLNLVPEILKRVPRIDIFHANAGMYIGGNLADNTPKHISDAVKLNLTVPLIHMNTVVPHMRENGGGQIVITSSLAAVLDTPFEPVYAWTKTAISKAARIVHDQESGNGIRVSAVSPGPTKTALFENWPEDKKAEMVKGGILEAEDVAQYVMQIVTRPPGVHTVETVIKPSTFKLG